MNHRKKLIVLIGEARVGKDTTADIIHYVRNNGLNPYSHIVVNSVSDEITRVFREEHSFAFGDNLKKITSEITGEPYENFFEDKDKIIYKGHCTFLRELTLREVLVKVAVFVKKTFGSSIFADNTLSNLRKFYLKGYNFAIITDLRFNAELRSVVTFLENHNNIDATFIYIKGNESKNHQNEEGDSQILSVVSNLKRRIESEEEKWAFIEIENDKTSLPKYKKLYEQLIDTDNIKRLF